MFRNGVEAKNNIVVDRMNFSIEQRRDFMIMAPDYDYEIVVFHQPYDVCLERMLQRQGHPTIKDEKSARSALRTFFTKYERPTPNEFLKVTYLYPGLGGKPSAVVCDLDGTLCDIVHRRHFVQPTEGKKKDWKSFYEGISGDSLNLWCAEILHTLSASHPIVLCSGRGSEYRQTTIDWLNKHEIEYDDLFMRFAGDHRKDSIVKEIILDFEILTRYTPHFMIDDRQQVVDMWRSRGFVCLQCDEGNF